MPINKKSDTKQKIITSAKKLFTQYGYKGTSVRKIASDVGIRESALYNHFKNKEEIFMEIAKEIFSLPFAFEDKNVQELAMQGKPFLEEYTKQYKLISFDKDKKSMFNLLLMELLQDKSIREQFISEFHNKNIKVLSGGFFVMMQNARIHSSDPIIIAYEFLSTLFYIRLQVAILSFDDKSTDDLSKQFDKHVDFFWDAIKA